MKKPCEEYSKLLAESFHGNEYNHFLNSNQDIFDLLIRESGINKNSSLEDVFGIYDALLAQVNIYLLYW